MSRRPTKLETEVAQIIDPTGWSLPPSAYGLKTEKEMLEKTMMGPIRQVAYERARRIIKMIEAVTSKDRGEA